MYHVRILRTEDGSLEPKNIANYVLIDYRFIVFDWINYFIVSYNSFIKTDVLMNTHNCI